MPSLNMELSSLPFSELIGAPFKAACDAQVIMAKTVEEFINEVGFVNTGGVDAKSTVRVLDFSFLRPVQDKSGNVIEEKVELQVPILSIVNIPNLSIKHMSVEFDVEIKSLGNSEPVSEEQEDAFTEPSNKSTNVNVYGKVSTHKDNTRSTDTSAKYHIEMYAEHEDTPEALARILDIMAASIAPRSTNKMCTTMLADNTANTDTADGASDQLHKLNKFEEMP